MLNNAAMLMKVKEKILDLPPDPDPHQNWIGSSMTHQSTKFSGKT